MQEFWKTGSKVYGWGIDNKSVELAEKAPCVHEEEWIQLMGYKDTRCARIPPACLQLHLPAAWWQVAYHNSCVGLHLLHGGNSGGCFAGEHKTMERWSNVMLPELNFLVPRLANPNLNWPGKNAMLGTLDVDSNV